ncbi:MAG: hypothetical protein KatS3mg035_0789 [Bacteroidia bacterium]|nr:MAG: hypothetical protein KatS3mg035_0789 [Bacteroidia bacterium]
MKKNDPSSSDLNFEKVWLLFQETDKKFQETDKKLQESLKETERIIKEAFQETDKKFQETDNKLQESLKETERIIKEAFQETDKKFQETDKKFQETDKKLRQLETLFTGHWGKLIESLVEGNLAKILKERGIDINGTSQRVTKIYHNQEYEIDILAHNGKDTVAVEVKTTLKIEHIKEFLETLQIFKKIFPEYRDKNVYGAVAYLKVEEEADKYAYRQGLFVIKATSESARIINDKKFKPKVF